MMASLSNTSSKRNRTGQSKKQSRISQETTIDNKKLMIFLSLILIILIATVSITYYMLRSDESKSDSLSFNCYNPEHSITPNGSAQFVLMLENKLDGKNTVKFEVTEKPENWSVHLDQDMAMLQKNTRKLVFLSVQSPVGVDTGEFHTTVRASSLLPDMEAGHNIKITLYPIPKVSNKTVQKDVEIAVNYVGYLADGTIFDTSVKSVAKNKDAPKVPDFSVRDEYLTPDFIAGTGGMIQGFDEGVMGMQLYQTRVIMVPPEKGYTTEGNEEHDLYGKTLYFEVTLEEFK